MGRKIPGKKHRQVKDPDKQKAVRFNKIKDKINNPPNKVDAQETPKSLLRIMELKEKAKKFKPRKGNKQKRLVFDMKKALGTEVKMPGMDRPNRHQLPELKQGPEENVFRFGRRIQSMCNELLKETEFEKQYGVEVTRDEVGRVVEVKKVKAVKRSKKPKLSEKRRDKLKKKGDVELPKEFPQRENVEFGDVVHAPPTNLRLPRAVEKNKTAPRPGQKNLLLKNVLNIDSKSPTKVSKQKIIPDILTKKSKKKLTPESLIKKSKKKLTPIEWQKQEERRISVVQAFRKSKKERMSL